MFIGVDVSKLRLDVAVRPGGEARQFANDEAGIADVVAWAQTLSPALVVMEASGGYEAACAAALVLAKVPTAVVNPRQVRSFADAIGKLAKTDGVDADVLAHFGEALRPAQATVGDEALRGLSELVQRRTQLVEMRVMETNRKGLASPAVRKELDAHIVWLNKRIKDADKDIHTRIRTTAVWREKAEILESAKGVGPTTVARLLVSLPELGTLTPKKAAALVGVAPYNNDSGERRGKRKCKGGRAELRAGLYMATLSAIRSEPHMKAFCRRLLEKGKPKKVAIIACMRKLLIALNAMLRDKKVWAAQ